MFERGRRYSSTVNVSSKLFTMFSNKALGCWKDHWRLSRKSSIEQSRKISLMMVFVKVFRTWPSQYSMVIYSWSSKRALKTSLTFFHQYLWRQRKHYTKKAIKQKIANGQRAPNPTCSTNVFYLWSSRLSFLFSAIRYIYGKHKESFNHHLNGKFISNSTNFQNKSRSEGWM